MKNLRPLYLLLILVGASTCVHAQDDEGAKFRFGLKGAPSMAWLKPDSKLFESGGATVKFSYGLITEFRVAKNYSFVTGLDVAYAGGKINYTDSIYYLSDAGDPTKAYFQLNKRKFDLQYVDLPVLLKMKTNEIGYMTYFGQFGFNLGLNIKSRAIDEGTTYASTQTVKKEDVDVIKDINLMRVAMNLGIGVEYNFSGSTSLLLGVNYNNGFSNTFGKESKSLKQKDGSALETKAVSNYVALTVGVLF
ncbi:MAG: PorT family protein [Flavobacteriales bacterium]|nr:PorT family protein [Flavobacteriales bacterium]MCB9449276.1 PorT family protein [Flavobacteriales bacterium]